MITKKNEILLNFWHPLKSQKFLVKELNLAREQCYGQPCCFTLYTSYISSRSARTLDGPQKWPQRADSTRATGVAAARGHHTGHRSGHNAHFTRATEVAAARALHTGYRSGRSARTLHRPQDRSDWSASAFDRPQARWPQRAGLREGR